jgi:hypothetical protein
VDAKRAAARRMARVDKVMPNDDAGAGPFPGLAEGDALTVGRGGVVVKRAGRVVGTERQSSVVLTAGPRRASRGSVPL